MDILINNPISHMYGPYFLWFYGFVICTTILGCKLALEVNPFNLTPLLIPDRPDPYEIAYLRDGEKAVSKLSCFELVQRGYLQVTNNQLKRNSETLDSNLNPIEKTLFDWFDKPRKATTLANSVTLKNAIAPHCQTYQQSLENSRYLITDKTKNWVAGIGTSIILSLGIYKLVSALSRGYSNVGFLIFMAIAATIWLIYAVYNQRDRLTRRGKQYLKNCQKTFSGLKGMTDIPPTEPDYNSSLIVALSGLDVLNNNTNYQDFAKLFAPATYSSTTSTKKSSGSPGCSSYVGCGAGSSCSSGSSCGSSCGGGGCGGGCGGCGGCGG